MMSDKYRQYLCAFGISIATAFLVLPAPSLGAQTSLGYTFTHIKVNCPEGALSHVGPLQPSLEASDNILLHYDDPRIRKLADNILLAMRQTSDALRLMIWIAFDDGNFSKNHQDRLGMVVSQKGEAPPRVEANLSNILREAESLGYTKAYIVFGNQGVSSPACRRTEFGDCFNANSLQESWTIREQFIESVQKQGPAHMPVYYDIALEACPGGTASPLMSENIGEFDTYMIKHYTASFSDNHFFVSCIGNPAKRGNAGLNGLSDLYRSLGARPHALDVHIDVRDASNVGIVLRYASADARNLGVPFTVLETGFGNEVVFSTIAKLRSEGELGNLETVGIWPKSANSSCAIDVQWPADLTDAAQALRQQPE